MSKFYVYVDYTQESIPRPFYVGKGNDERVQQLTRNQKHVYVSKKHGFQRRVVFSTDDEHQAFEHEEKLIAELHTFINDPEAESIASNFTLGGDGIAGINERNVYQYDHEGNLIRTYDSIRHLSREMNVHHALLCSALQGKAPMPLKMRDFEWKMGKKRRFEKVKNHGNGITVLEIDPQNGDVIGEYDSISRIVRERNVSYAYFMYAIRTQQEKYVEKVKQKTGSYWRLKDEKNNVPQVKKYRNKKPPTRSKQVVITSMTSGEEKIFPSVTAAAIHLKVGVNILLKILHKKSTKINDWTCRFVDDSDATLCGDFRSGEWRQKMSGINGHKIEKVDEHGVVVNVYQSFVEAENAERLVNREMYTALTSGSVFWYNNHSFRRMRREDTKS